MPFTPGKRLLSMPEVRNSDTLSGPEQKLPSLQRFEVAIQ